MAMNFNYGQRAPRVSLQHDGLNREYRQNLIDRNTSLNQLKKVPLDYLHEQEKQEASELSKFKKNRNIEIKDMLNSSNNIDELNSYREKALADPYADHQAISNKFNSISDTLRSRDESDFYQKQKIDKMNANEDFRVLSQEAKNKQAEEQVRFGNQKANIAAANEKDRRSTYVQDADGNIKLVDSKTANLFNQQTAEAKRIKLGSDYASSLGQTVTTKEDALAMHDAYQAEKTAKTNYIKSQVTSKYKVPKTPLQMAKILKETGGFSAVDSITAANPSIPRDVVEELWVTTYDDASDDQKKDKTVMNALFKNQLKSIGYNPKSLVDTLSR